MNRLFCYIGRHWKGEMPLAQAFWLNFVLLYCLLQAGERLLFPPYVVDENLVAAGFAAHALIAKLIVFGWQAVGVLRSCGKSIASDSNPSWGTAGQFAVAGGLVMTIVLLLDSYQNLRMPPEEPAYSLELVRGGSLIHLRGPLEVGISARVGELIARNPAVEGIILDSGGGQIYQGRGLALLIRQHGLDTYTLEKCFSSCATAFIAGNRRTLGANALIGFHRYKTHSVIPSIDVPAEQLRDMRIFESQGVPQAFLRRAFSYAPEEMWRPSESSLLEAGIVHRVGFVFAD